MTEEQTKHTYLEKMDRKSFEGRPLHDWEPRKAISVSNTAVQHLDTLEGTYVQCRLPNGTDAYVPLKEIFVMFERKMIDNIKYKGYAL